MRYKEVERKESGAMLHRIIKEYIMKLMSDHPYHLERKGDKLIIEIKMLKKWR